MRSHFLPPCTAAATAVAGALTMLNGNCTAQNFIAADYATNATYASGWSAGQNGGHGFGPWSFDGTNLNPPGQYQGISTSSHLGRSWTLANYANNSGLADAGRAISGGLQPGQTLEAVIQNPTGYHFYRGFDIMFMNATNNNFGGVNTAAFRCQVFGYFVNPAVWHLNDASGSGDTITPLDVNATAAGMRLDLTLLSTNTYSFTMTPLGDSSLAYTNSGTLTTNLPINWINFRLYNTASSGMEDTANNYEVSSFTISGLPLNIHQAGPNVILSWPGLFTNFALVSSTNLGANASWNPVQPDPVLVDGQNVVTNPIAGARTFYRLRLLQ
jgi:hypothetical protein